MSNIQFCLLLFCLIGMGGVGSAAESSVSNFYWIERLSESQAKEIAKHWNGVILAGTHHNEPRVVLSLPRPMADLFSASDPNLKLNRLETLIGWIAGEPRGRSNQHLWNLPPSVTHLDRSMPLEQRLKDLRKFGGETFSSMMEFGIEKLPYLRGPSFEPVCEYLADTLDELNEFYFALKKFPESSRRNQLMRDLVNSSTWVMELFASVTRNEMIEWPDRSMQTLESFDGKVFSRINSVLLRKLLHVFFVDDTISAKVYSLLDYSDSAKIEDVKRVIQDYWSDIDPQVLEEHSRLIFGRSKNKSLIRLMKEFLLANGVGSNGSPLFHPNYRAFLVRSNGEIDKLEKKTSGLQNLLLNSESEKKCVQQLKLVVSRKLDDMS